MKTPDKSWVLVTGASSGFSEEFARQYAEQGYSLVLVARRLDRLQRLAEALRQQFRVDVVVVQVHPQAGVLCGRIELEPSLGRHHPVSVLA